MILDSLSLSLLSYIQELFIGVNAMDPTRGRSFHRWRFMLKIRNGWHSVSVSRRRNLPSVMGLTRGSNHAPLPPNRTAIETDTVVLLEAGASPRLAQTGAVQSKGVPCLVSTEEARGDVTGC